jgi:hypothetical protein
MQNTKSAINFSFNSKSWLFFVIAILFLSILRGIRSPNLWSYSHYLFNYDFGFVKRGFIGEIISRFDNPYFLSYEFFVFFSIGLFTINMIILCFLFKDFIKSQNPVLMGCSFVFSSSLAVVYLSNTIGYFDHIGLFIALVTLKICGFYKKLAFLLLSIPFALLIHEAILIIFFPVIFMSLLLNIKAKDRVRKLIILGLFSALSIIFLFFISNHTLQDVDVNHMYEDLQTRTDIPLHWGAFFVLQRDSKENFGMMQHKWSGNMSRYKKLGMSLLVTAPIFLLFIYFSVLILKNSKAGFLIILLAVLASISPLLMHFFGWDMHRWNTLAVTTSFLLLHVVATERSENSPIITNHDLFLLFVFIVFMNGISMITLFDGYGVQQFPFFEHQTYIIDFISGRLAFPYSPPL